MCLPGQKILRRHFFYSYGRVLGSAMLLALSACAGHTNPVALDQSKQQTLRVIGLPQFSDQKRIDMRQKIKRRLRKLGYRVRDLDMTYWQAQTAYRKKDARLKDVNALLRVNIKRFGYFSASPYKPYRPGMVVMADLISTPQRQLMSSNVYNVGYNPKDISRFYFQVNYMTHIHVADKRYFYRDFKTLMSHAKASSKGLKFIVSVAAESVAGDLKMRRYTYALTKK